MAEETESPMDRLKRAYDSYEEIELVKDYRYDLPISVHSDGLIVLEMGVLDRRGRLHCEWSDQAKSFLTDVAEVVSRTELIHMYRLTPLSISTACSYGITAKTILQVLTKLCKHALPKSLVQFVEKHCEKHGLIVMAFSGRRSYVHCRTLEVANELRGDERFRLSLQEPLLPEDVNFTVKPKHETLIREVILSHGFPIMEEYEFERDTAIPDLQGDVRLPSGMEIRPYQRQALSRIFCGRSDRARSGIVVLPCGAGKTLCGILALCGIRKSAVILCNNTMACKQWCRELVKCTSIENIYQFNGDKDAVPDLDVLSDPEQALVVVTTYMIMGMSRDARREEARPVIDQMIERDWGLVILDEVHMAPADKFKLSVSALTSRCKLGLTATLLREDCAITDLNYLVGPKLFDISWQQLAAEGYIATVKCYELLCPMAYLFLEKYMPRHKDVSGSCGSSSFYEFNPNKIEAARMIMEDHERQGHKILIFADRVGVITNMARMFHRYMIHGQTKSEEREHLLKAFRKRADEKGSLQTLILSRVGDVGIDLPEANVIIEIDFHGKSRRQEAQRLGRILRAKPGMSESIAYFYSLVTPLTPELVNAQQRRSYLLNEGYIYRALPWEEFKNDAMAKRKTPPGKWGTLDYVPQPDLLSIREQDVYLKCLDDISGLHRVKFPV
jgi:DNA excision repair protein ERCC-3